MDTEIAALDHTHPDFESLYGKVLNFIDDKIEPTQLKEELIRYAFTLGREEAAEHLPKSRIGVEGAIAYCINRGALLAPSSIQRVITLLDTMAKSDTEAEDESAGWEDLPENARVKAVQAYVACYSHIDNAKTRVLRGKLSMKDLAPEVRSVLTKYGNGKNVLVKQLFAHYKEAYADARIDACTKDWVKPLATIVETIYLILNSRAAVKSGAKGAKNRKMTSDVHNADRKGEKAASKVTYKDEDLNLGIRSVDPTNVVGATAAVVFNTKNRHCEVYFAKEDSKLSVQGARITNYDEATSTGRTLRKPETDLPHWTKASSLKRLTVLLKDGKGKPWELTGKLNKNTLIIKVVH